MSFHCSVVSPEAELYSGEVESVVVPGYDDGDVGFLTGHCPYIGSLGCGRLRIREVGGTQHEFVVYQGFVQFSQNVLTVLASSAQEPSEITQAMVDADTAEIPTLPSKTLSEYNEKQLRMSMRKARLSVLANR